MTADGYVAERVSISGNDVQDRALSPPATHTSATSRRARTAAAAPPAASGSALRQVSTRRPVAADDGPSRAPADHPRPRTSEPMPVAALLPAAAFGLIIGSFLNVVAYRLPRARVAGARRARTARRASGRSSFYDNIPVLSWLLLRGRCRDCSEPIATRYPLVEAAHGGALRRRRRRACRQPRDARPRARARRLPRADRADRLRQQDHPQPADAAGGGPRGRARHGAGPGRRDRAADRRRWPPAPCSRCRRCCIRRAWGWATPSSSPCSACSSARPSRPPSSSRSSSARSRGVAIMMRKGMSQARARRRSRSGRSSRSAASSASSPATSSSSAYLSVVLTSPVAMRRAIRAALQGDRRARPMSCPMRSVRVHTRACAAALRCAGSRRRRTARSSSRRWSAR